MSNSPRISDNQIKQIRILSKRFGIPMTKVVRVAIDHYLKKCEKVFKVEDFENRDNSPRKSRKRL